MSDIRPYVDAELNRRGVAVVAALLANDDAVGIGRGAEVRLFATGLSNPERGYVEDWLGRKERETAVTAAHRHQEVTKSAQEAAKYAAWSAVVGAISAVAGIIAVILSAVPLLK
jgi:hypothetical protein